MAIVSRVKLAVGLLAGMVLGMHPCSGLAQFISAPQPSLTVASSRLPGLNPDGLAAPLPGSYPGAFIVRPVRQVPPTPPFLSDRWNRTLVTADLGVRMLDAFSSWINRPSLCPCCPPEQVLPQSWSNSLPTMLVFSTTVSATVDLSARFLWRRHRPRLSRIVLMSDIAGDGEAGIGNLRVYVQAQNYAAALPAKRPPVSPHR